MRRLGILLLLTACGGDDAATPDATPLPTWHGDLPDSAVMGTNRGLRHARGIIHLHSPYSHDACDGNPRGDTETGPIDEACLADLRAALCTTRMDYANLTDHDDTMADEEFTTLFSMRDDDDAVMDGVDQLASQIHCDNAHDVLVTIGSENPLMPIMLDHHVAGTVQERHDIYNGDDAATVTAMRAAGATVWIPHTEQRTTPELMTLLPDGIEVYQLHANIDPDIREQYLGLEAGGAITNVIAFADTNPGGAEPDLALLSFLEPNTPSLTRWDEMLAMGYHLAGSGGTDAHQNALPVILRDGERGDSYRRMIRWFSNVVLVDAVTPQNIEAALRAGRMFVLFEIMGTPDGFDVHAEVPGGDPVELGGTVAADAGATLEVDIPSILALDASLPAPTITAKIIRVTASGPETVAEGGGDTLTTPLDTAGAYRVVIEIRPSHLGPYLGNLGTEYVDRTLPWIYASPIYVQ